MQFVYGNLCIILYEKWYPLTSFRMLILYLMRFIQIYFYIAKLQPPDVFVKEIRRQLRPYLWVKIAIYLICNKM